MEILLVSENVHYFDVQLKGRHLVLEVGREVRLMPHADKGDFLYRLARVFCLALLEGSIIEASNQLIEILARGNPVDGHDFDHTPVFLTVEQAACREWIDLQCLVEQFFGLYRVAEDIVVVDVIDVETRVESAGLVIFRYQFLGLRCQL